MAGWSPDGTPGGRDRDCKKGTTKVGVGRQYTGTAGKIDNAQVAVYLAYAPTGRHGVIDRELYLPQGVAGRRRPLHATAEHPRVGGDVRG